MSGGPPLHRFRHHAMATFFEAVIAGEDPDFAAQASRAVFEEIDRLEEDLSRYRPNSDVARINNLEPGGRTRVSADTMECLLLAQEYWRSTGGAFDCTLGALMDCWLGPDRSLRAPPEEEVAAARQRCGMGLLELDPETMSVGTGAFVPVIDPGAIGKGFAVDRGMDLLKEWGVGAALLHGGTSTVAGYGREWPVTMSSFLHPDRVIRTVHLRDSALSGSGVKKGSHIMDGRSGRPVSGRSAAWVCAPTATASDALSTAFMLMEVEEIRSYCARFPDLAVVLLEPEPEGERMITAGRATGWRDGGEPGDR